MKQLNVTGPVCQTGYGIAVLNLVLELNKKVEVTLFPLGEIQAPPNTHSTLKECIQRQDTFNWNVPDVRIYHQFDMAQSVGKGLRVGFPIFELDTFKPREIHHLSSMDMLLVCSEWARNIIWQNQISVPTYIVPLGVDRLIFDNFLPKTRKDDDCVFLNMGKWEIRKGHDILGEAFNLAFTPEDKVKLVMHCHNPFLTLEENMEWTKLYLETDMGKAGKIVFTRGKFATPNDVAKIMNDCDVGVFPARAEGWNLELIEMMSLGKQVITTSYSGHSHYANEENADLLGVTEFEDAYDDKWFFGEGKWATLNVEELAHLMRSVYDSGKWKEVNAEGINTAKQFSWSNSADKLLEALEIGNK